MNQDAVYKLERLLKIANEKARAKIMAEGVNREVQLLLLMKELIKEQMPNENSGNTTR